MVSLFEISLHWVNGKNQLDDVMTKRVATPDALLKVLDSGQLYVLIIPKE